MVLSEEDRRLVSSEYFLPGACQIEICRPKLTQYTSSKWVRTLLEKAFIAELKMERKNESQWKTHGLLIIEKSHDS